MFTSISSGVGKLPCFTTYIPLIKLYKFSLYLFVYFFAIIMTGEPAHSTLEERMSPGLLFSSDCVSQLSITEITKWKLCFIFSYVQPVTWHYKWRTLQEGPFQSH